VNKLPQTVFSDEDMIELKILAEEMPTLRVLVDELLETLEILGDENLLRVFVQARKLSEKTG